MEGPSLVILREELKPFIKKTVIDATGNAKFGPHSLINEKLRSVKTWGKHLLLTIGKCVLRLHFLMFGSYRINATKDRSATLSLTFENGEVHFYSTSIRTLDQPINELYDWRIDVMSRKWDATYVRRLVKAHPNEFVSDVLLDQSIFAGVGNIIKCEVLFNLGIYPETKIKDLSPRTITALVAEAHRYSHQFYRWKKKYVLKKNWRIYRKGTCPVSGNKVVAKMMGKRERYTYYCPICQPTPIRSPKI